MKKKAIEKVPYLTLPQSTRKKDVKYIAVTAFKMIAHERHLFVEVYRNSRTSRDIPVVRIVLTKKDFGNYFPESGEWTRQRIEPEHGYNGKVLIWHKDKDRPGTWEQAQKENILFCIEDRERIKQVCGTRPRIFYEENWWEHIYNHEDDIIITARRAAETRKYNRRKEALKERAENTPELPEKSILDRAETIYLAKHFLYYKKRGCWADIVCSKCGGVSHGRWKVGISYMSQFQHWIEDPREGQIGECPLCKAEGIYKCQGKAKEQHSESIHLFLGQKYKETGMVMRYLEVTKTWNLDLMCGEKDMEMTGAGENLSLIEIARAYYAPGEEPKIDYHKINPYTWENYWDDCNIYGLNHIRIEDAQVLPETYKEVSGTMFQYSAMREYGWERYRYNPMEYLKHYQKTPQIEMLVKMGLIEVVDRLVKCYYGIVADLSAERPDKFLGIEKRHMKKLMEKKGDVELLKAMQIEHRRGATWTDEQIEHIAEAHLNGFQIETATKYMSLQKLLNRIEKYAGCEWGTGCSIAEQRLKDTATKYTDYLNMRLALGYDLTNSIYQQPRSLQDAHEKMVLESNKKEQDKRLEEVKTRFPDIRKQYRKLRNRYFYEDDQFLIRPARSAEEIVQEGQILHHCVGGDTYLGKHNEGKTYILMLRKKAAPEIPYITVEIDGKEDRIRQWYGAHDKKPDEKNMKRWLDTYLTKLKCGALAAGVTEEQTAGDQVLLTAI